MRSLPASPVKAGFPPSPPKTPPPPPPTPPNPPPPPPPPPPKTDPPPPPPKTPAEAVWAGAAPSAVGAPNPPVLAAAPSAVGEPNPPVPPPKVEGEPNPAPKPGDPPVADAPKELKEPRLLVDAGVAPSPNPACRPKGGEWVEGQGSRGLGFERARGVQ